MKHLGLRLSAITLVCLTSWGPAVAAEQSCMEEVQMVSDQWQAVRDENVGDDDPASITVETEDGATEVPVQDAEPTENWFGRPPEAEAVERDLSAARAAAESGDDEACMEYLNNVKSLLDKTH